MGDLKRVVKYFSKSTKASTALTDAREEDGVPRGLEKFGKTRFATNFYSSASVERCLPSICKVVTDEGINLTVNIKALSSQEQHSFRNFDRASTC